MISLLSLLCVIQGRMVEIYGREASGKTTLALHIIKEAQKRGGGVNFSSHTMVVESLEYCSIVALLLPN